MCWKVKNTEKAALDQRGLSCLPPDDLEVSSVVLFIVLCFLYFCSRSITECILEHSVTELRKQGL